MRSTLPLRAVCLQQRSISTTQRIKKVPAFREHQLKNLKLADRPVVLRGCFQHVAAIQKWFKPMLSYESAQELNLDYLQPYADTLVPLELTRTIASFPDAPQTSTFERFEAPLSLLLAHASQKATEASQDRLYLAQCPLEDLPLQLRVDLPMPDLVFSAGKGDVYGSSLWMGSAPTRTPLHRDPNPNIFLQLAGQKHVRLMEPELGRDVYERARAGTGHANLRGEEMMAGKEMERLESAVWQSGEEGVGEFARLEAGDGLFIPLGWWHAVHGVGKGITASVNWWFR